MKTVAGTVTFTISTLISGVAIATARMLNGFSRSTDAVYDPTIDLYD